MSEQFYLQKLILSDDQEVVVQTVGWESDEPSLKLVIRSKPETVFEGIISKYQLKHIAESLSQNFEEFLEESKKALTEICTEFTYELTANNNRFSWSKQVGRAKVIYCSVYLAPHPTLQPFDLLAKAAETHAKLKEEARSNKLEADLYLHNIKKLNSDYSEILQSRVKHENDQAIKFRDILNAKSKLIEELEEQLTKYAEETNK